VKNINEGLFQLQMRLQLQLLRWKTNPHHSKVFLDLGDLGKDHSVFPICYALDRLPLLLSI